MPQSDILPAESPLQVNCDKPTRKEVRGAILGLKNGKAEGSDEIPGEALKVAPDTSSLMLGHLIEKIWETEEAPDDWREVYLVKLPKKGDQTVCRNKRGITLLLLLCAG